MTNITAAVKKNSGINSLADLKGKTSPPSSGSTSIQLLRVYKKTENIEVQETARQGHRRWLPAAGQRPRRGICARRRATGRSDCDVQEPGEYRLLKESLRQEPYGIMFRKDDPAFKEVVDQRSLGLMKSGAIDELYAKWFTKPIPSNNINLAFPMSDAVRNAFRNPNNNGV